MLQCKLIETEELFDRQLAGSRHGDIEAFIEPGMMWFMPWVYDHQDPDLEQYLPRLLKDSRRRQETVSLSHYYLSKWATIRDPLAIKLPYDKTLYVDSAPAGTEGWEVTSRTVSAITVRQAIRAGNYSYRLTGGILSTQGYHDA